MSGAPRIFWGDNNSGGGGGQGPAGQDGRTILNGSGAPEMSIGVVGDYYINNDTYEIYGPKTAASWGDPTSLIGAQGPAGQNGQDGANGADGQDGRDGVGKIKFEKIRIQFQSTQFSYTLTSEPLLKSTLFWIKDGSILEEGVGHDYIIDGDEIVLNNTSPVIMALVQGSIILGKWVLSDEEEIVESVDSTTYQAVPPQQVVFVRNFRGTAEAPEAGVANNAANQHIAIQANNFYTRDFRNTPTVINWNQQYFVKDNETIIIRLDNIQFYQEYIKNLNPSYVGSENLLQIFFADSLNKLDNIKNWETQQASYPVNSTEWLFLQSQINSAKQYFIYPFKIERSEYFVDFHFNLFGDRPYLTLRNPTPNILMFSKMKFIYQGVHYDFNTRPSDGGNIPIPAPDPVLTGFIEDRDFINGVDLQNSDKSKYLIEEGTDNYDGENGFIIDPSQGNIHGIINNATTQNKISYFLKVTGQTRRSVHQFYPSPATYQMIEDGNYALRIHDFQYVAGSLEIFLAGQPPYNIDDSVAGQVDFFFQGINTVDPLLEISLIAEDDLAYINFTRLSLHLAGTVLAPLAVPANPRREGYKEALIYSRDFTDDVKFSRYLNPVVTNELNEMTGELYDYFEEKSSLLSNGVTQKYFGVKTGVGIPEEKVYMLFGRSATTNPSGPYINRFSFIKNRRYKVTLFNYRPHANMTTQLSVDGFLPDKFVSRTAIQGKSVQIYEYYFTNSIEDTAKRKALIQLVVNGSTLALDRIDISEMLP